MYRKIFLMALGILFAVTTAFAQYGKISGKVIDRETKDPLPAANVVIVGTTLGAAADAEGNYVILNVPAGMYDVKASYIGYQDVTIRNVRVTSGLTQEVNFGLPSTAVEVGPVEIVAERPLIEKSATNTVRMVRGEDVAKLPIRGGATEYFKLLPGVVVQNDRIFIRGGRPTEVGYRLEGANVTNIVGGRGATEQAGAGRSSTADEIAGSLVVTVPEALEEAMVQAGGYTAEYGGANSGIASATLKTGRERYTGVLQAETDNFGVYPGEKFLDTYSYGYSDYVVTLSGPLPRYEKVKFFLAGQNSFTRDYAPTFWSGSKFFGKDTLQVADTGDRGGTKGEKAVLKWDPGNIPGRMRNRYAFNGTVLFDYKPLLVKVASSLSWQRIRSNGSPIITLFDTARLPLTDESSGFVNVKGTYLLSPERFVEANLNYLDERSKTYDPNFKEDVLLYADSLEAAKRGWKYRSYSDPPRPYDFHGFPFLRPGALLTGYTKNQNSYMGGSVSLTSLYRQHEIKVGGSYENWTVRMYGLGNLQQLLTAMRTFPDSARSEEALRRLIRTETWVNNFGFDEFGNRIEDDRVLSVRNPDGSISEVLLAEGPKHPRFGAIYVQDKMEFRDFIANVGLRWDFLDLDTWRFKDPNKPWDPGRFAIKDLVKEKRTFSYLSPRIGLSFPVTDRTVFHLQYGRFVQAPTLFSAYRGSASAALIFTGQFFFTNPVGYDVEPTRTTQYEIGFSQQFTDFAAFDVTGFYKDIKGELQYDLFFVNRAIATVGNYPIYTNADFATTKGIELSLTLRRISRIQAQVNYTLSDARGTNSFPASAAGALNVTGIKPTYVTPLLYNQKHRGTINVDYRFAKGDGGPILQRLGINLLFTFNSGHPFTRSTGGLGQQGPDTGGILDDSDSRLRQPLEPINNSTTPWNFNLDLRLDKTVSVGGLDLNVYAYVQNVFNTKNVINVYNRTGNAFDDGFLTNPLLSEKIVGGLGPRYVEMYKLINLENRQHQWRRNGIDLFGPPRQIRAGVRVEF